MIFFCALGIIAKNGLPQGQCCGPGQFKEWICGALHRLPGPTKAKHAGTHLEFNETMFMLHGSKPPVCRLTEPHCGQEWG